MNTRRHGRPPGRSFWTSAARALTIAVAVTTCMVMLDATVAKEVGRVEHQADPGSPCEKRIASLLADLTLEEKVRLLAGEEMDTKANARLGIPVLAMADGPHGVRHGQSTCFPTSVAMGASWDEALIERVGVALAREMLAKGRNVLLGPCINIQRVPHGGRNFESFSEDPYQAARLAVAYVEGVQGQGVVATPKHFACNNQEWERTTIDVQVDERALREIYLPAFRACVQEADCWAIMAAYNKVNGPYACANRRLLTDILKDEWGFQGLVMSDWGAVHSTVETANAGLDLEMPRDDYFGPALLDAVKRGEVAEAVIDDKVRRILRVMFLAGLFDEPRKIDREAVDCAAHRALALEVAHASIVLLKNEGDTLPLDREKLRSIAVIGPNADVARLGGGGSSEVTPTHSVSPLEGIMKKVGGKVTVRHVQACALPGEFPPIDSECLVPPTAAKGMHGLRGEYFDNKDFRGKPVLTRIDAQVDFEWGTAGLGPGIPSDNFSVRWTGKLVPVKSGPHVLAAISDDGSRLFLDGKLVIDNWGEHAVQARTAPVELQAGQAYDVRLEYYESGGAASARLGWSQPGADPFAEAVAAARESDVAIVFAGLSKRFEGEAVDKTDLELPGRQAELIEVVAAANPRTVVVLNTGTPVLMDRWLGKVPALVEAWYAGQEGGDAIADVLFGDVNPSGKLPVTFPKSWADCPAHGNYPGKDGAVRYAEGIFVGYRHFDAKRIEPLFPFGHGLSYTQFQYADLRVLPEAMSSDDTVQVTLSVKNTGPRDGSDVVQLYVHDAKASVERPAKELERFQKLHLRRGESRDVTFTLDRQSLSFYDPSVRRWVAEPGQFEILIGSSSRDIRLRGSFALR